MPTNVLFFVFSSCHWISVAKGRIIQHPDNYDGKGDFDMGGVWGGRDDALVRPNLMSDHHNAYYTNRLHSGKPLWTAFLGHKELMEKPAWDLHESWNDQDRDYYGKKRQEGRRDDFCDGGDSCCQNHPNQRCGIGEGDCDEDMDCEQGLVCGIDNCRAWGSGFDSTDDCCRDPCDGEDSCCSRDSVCKEGEGDCDSDSDCEDDLKCGKDNCRGFGFDSTDDCCFNPVRPWGNQCQGGDTCCTEENQCFEGEGDCDNDSDCRGNLRCGTDNCFGEGFDDTDDCCMRPW